MLSKTAALLVLELFALRVALFVGAYYFPGISHLSVAFSSAISCTQKVRKVKNKNQAATFCRNHTTLLRIILLDSFLHQMTVVQTIMIIQCTSRLSLQTLQLVSAMLSTTQPWPENLL